MSVSRLISLIVLSLIFLFSTANAPVLADTSPQLDLGAKVFQANCAGCHAKGGNIVRRGKNLKLKALRKNKVDNLEAITNLVTNGKNNMSAYGDKLTTAEIIDVSAFVLHQAEIGWK